MRYYIFINEKKKNKNGMFPIIIVFRNGNNMFNVSTGLTTTEKFEGFVFPKSQINSAAKTAVLAKIIGEVEEYILLHKQTPYDEQKAALREISAGKCKPNQRQRHWPYM